MAQSKTDLENLLKDEEFIRWAVRPTADSERYWKAWMEAHPECKEDVLKAKELILSFDFHKEKPSEGVKQEVLENIIRKGNHTRLEESTKTNNRFLFITSLAASIILLIVFAFRNDLFPEETEQSHPIVKNEMVVKSTPTGVKLQTTLPDGSKVWLNSESRLTYNQDYGHAMREVYLQGEAFFEVMENKVKPFIVYSGELKITALGTSFNVNAITSTESSVALVTGKVEVVNESGKKKESVVLEPGQRVVHNIHSSALLTSEFSFDMVIGWKNGILSFENAGFHEVKGKLEKWYGVKINSDLPNTHNWNYTGKFDNQSLEIVLQRLAYIKKFKYEIKDNSVYLFN